MDVEKRPPVISQPSISPPPPQNLNLPLPPSQAALPPPLPSANDALSITQPEPVLDRPRKEQSGDSTQDEQPSQGHSNAFQLDPLAATVARYDPKSGEKINKMRKSYDNHLKSFGLLGKNRSVKHEEAVASVGGQKLMSLSELVAWPEEEWQMQKVHGKDVVKGLPEAVKAKLEKAFTMNPGPVPEQAKWDDILGIERPVQNAANNVKGRKDGVNGNGASTTGAGATQSQNANANASGDHIRARRNTKKRRYDDGSFEGYGEGFVDDEMDNDGYESGETYTSRNSRGSKGDRKRRKTQDFGKTGPSRTGSFASVHGR